MINQLAKKIWFPLILRVFTAVIFIIFLMVLYFGSLELIFEIKSRKIMFVIWTLWWPFLYISLIFFGRIWCGFLCPIGLTNEIGNSLADKKSGKDIFLKYTFLPFAVFFIIVFWEQISGLFTSAKITFYFLMSFFVFAIVFGVFISRWSFCRNFCPIGTLFKPFSRLSFFGMRTNKNVCKSCKTKECIKGGKTEPCPAFIYVPEISSNKECLMCTNCIKNCPYDSPKLEFMKPGKEIENKTQFSLSESLFIISLFGLSVLLTSKGTQLFRFFEITNGVLLRFFDFALWVGFSLLVYILVTSLHSRIYKENFKENLKNGGYLFLPFVFSLMFILIFFGFLAPSLKINLDYMSISKYFILLIGAGWSINLSRKLYSKKSIIYVLTIILIFLFWILILIPGPLSLIKAKQVVYIAEQGEIVNMKAFSMGFEPNVIKIKSADYFEVNITNSDIVHSFDIDELGIHMVINEKKSKTIKVNLPEEKGEYEFYCAIPGHREAGMYGKLIIE